MMAGSISRPTALLCIGATQAALCGGLAWLAAAQRLDPAALAAAGALATAVLLALVLQLYRQQAAAERATQAKSAFLAQMNHELRTPLSGVIANLELLRVGDLSREQRELVEGCMSAGKGLLGIVGNTLDLAKIEAGKLSLVPGTFDPCRMVDDVAAIYRSAAQEKQTELTTRFSGRLPRRVVADELRLRQVLCNLVGNAVKFTEAGRIRLSLQAERIDTTTARLRLRVEDSGIGFSPLAAATLFEPFRQADSGVARDFGGSGLGLAIARHLVVLHGGAIACSAQPGVGACFTVDLSLPVTEWAPEAEAAEVAAQDPPPAETTALPRFAPGTAPSLLVVEDQVMNRRILQRQLRDLGIEADLAADGAEALTLLDHRHYDVVITDCALPGMNGLELIRRLRLEEEVARRPRSRVVVLTANAIKGLAEDCRAAGADAFLAKPLKLATLAAVLTRADGDEAAAAAPRRAAPTKAPTAAPFDRAALAELIGGDHAGAVDAVARDFLAAWQDSLAAIRQRLAARDAAGLAEAAHAARGNARYGAAPRLARLCTRLEAQAQAGFWSEAAAAVEDLKIETARLQSHLSETGVIGHEYRRSA